MDKNKPKYNPRKNKERSGGSRKMGNRSSETTVRIINPYNFVPLIGKCERNDFSVCNVNGEKLFTGFFLCEIESLTPVFVPDTSSGSGGADFYSYQEKPESSPVIPGSEIRGVLRSVHEAAFNGCMSVAGFEGNEEILERVGGYAPCSSNKICATCKIFGMVSKKENETFSLASSVRIQDAVVKEHKEKEGDYYCPKIRLKPLGEPRPTTNIEFYTLKKDNVQENDFYLWRIRKNQYDSSRIRIRGRKFYWHQEISEDLHEIRALENSENSLIQDIRPIKRGIVFTFKIFFEKLNLNELKQLRFTIDFQDPGCAHKIGRGKPLGLGSVKIKIVEVKFRSIDKVTGEWNLKSEPIENFNYCVEKEAEEENNVIENLKLIADFSAHKKMKNIEITYPYEREITGNENPFGWYEWNRKCREIKGKQKNVRSVKKALPTITEDTEINPEGNKALYVVEKKGDKTYRGCEP